MEIQCPKCDTTIQSERLNESVACPSCGTVILEPTQTFCGTPTCPGTSDDSQEITSETEELAAPATSASAPTVPGVLGRYEIRKLLGRGGFGSVFLAHDTHLHRMVAIKVPLREVVTSSSGREQFLEEARTSAELDHPGIVSVYDAGQTDAGQLYVVMQFVDGTTLQEAFATRRYTFRESAALIAKLALALQYAHQKGFFHRDVKPANILIDSMGEPRIGDFGLAIRYRDQMSKAWHVAGTPRFMSPEQVRGETHRLDGRTDIWGLGAIFYRLLTGELPFRGDRQQLAEEIVSRHPRPPRQINPTIPKELERICLKCLQKEPNDRYLTAIDLAEDLQAWVYADSVEKRTDSAAKDQPQIPRAYWQVKSVVAAVVGLALLAGLTLAVFELPLGMANWGFHPKPSADPSERSFPLEKRAVPLLWVPLLEHKPDELLWSPWETARWNYDPTRQDCLVDNPDIAMLRLGRTAATDFRLQVTISKSSWTGSAGLFWGYNRTSENELDDSAACEVVELLAYPDPVETKLRIQWEHLSLGPTAAKTRPSLATERRWVEFVPIPTSHEGVLEIRVSGGLLRSVSWRGIELPGFSEQPGFVASSGQFGIIAANGAAGFRDARFMLLKGTTR